MINMNLKEASETIKKNLSETLDKPSNGTTSISKEDSNWTALVEVIEEEYLPGTSLKSMNDIIAVYDVMMSDKGEILSYTKKSTHKRGN
jgi:hypothetical protein